MESTYKAELKYVMCMSFTRGKPLKFKWDRHKRGDTSFEWLNSIWIHNIAFEFDQSWMDDFPRDFDHLKSEKNSARGCWARYFIGSLKTDHLNLWIIDKNAKWLRDSDHDYDTIYRDCEGDYVEIDNEDIFDHTGGGRSATASAFIGAACDQDDLIEWGIQEKLLYSKDYREWRYEMEDYARAPAAGKLQERMRKDWLVCLTWRRR
jgi:hypothetical protein